MPSIYRDFTVKCAPQVAWSALEDIGAVHTRLAKGFVTETNLEGDVRKVTFSNGIVATERILSIDSKHKRIAYCLIDGRVPHHSASFQVFDEGEKTSRIVWITDVFPDEALKSLEPMVDQGVLAIQATLSESS